jgi:hypothetical protein
MNPIALTSDETCALQFFQGVLSNVPRRGHHFAVLRTDAWTNLQFAQFRNIHHADIPQAYRSDLPLLVNSLWIKTHDALMGPCHHEQDYQDAKIMDEKIHQGGGKAIVFIAPQTRILAEMLNKH